MKLLVTGAGGQLGSAAVREAVARGHEVFAADRAALDVTDPVQTGRVMERVRPDGVIHCAAFTDVDGAERRKDEAFAVNAAGTERLARAAARMGARFLFVSTDFVFDGSGDTPWKPADPPRPINVYGASKLAGEAAVRAEAEAYFIVRTSRLFGGRGKNFADKLLEIGRSREELFVVSDRIGSPTYTYDLAKLLLDLIESERFGIYHAVNEGFCSQYDFACELFHRAAERDPRYARVRVLPIAGEAYPAPARRPRNSRLDTGGLTVRGFHRLPAWQDALGRCLGGRKF